jgi:succinyl-diaminopimelate desuccinylase
LIKYDTSTPEGLTAAAGFVRGWLESREIDVQTREYGGARSSPPRWDPSAGRRS